MFFFVFFDFVSLKSIWSETRIATPTYFCSPFCWYIFLHPFFWGFVYPCMWDQFPGYSTLIGFGFLFNLLVCVFWLGHLVHLHLGLILFVWIWSCHFDASWLFCPLVDAYFSFCLCSLPFGIFLEYLVLVVLSMCSASFRSSCKAGLVVTKALSTCLFAKDFIFSSFVKLSLAGYKILGWKFLSLRMLNIGSHSLLACRISADISAVSLMGFSLWVIQPFSLAALSIYSFI